MQVRDVMTKEVKTLQDTDTLLDAMLAFVRASLRHLPVLHGQELVGVVTDRDVRKFSPSVLSGISPDEYNRVMESTLVSSIMTRNPLTATPDDSILEVAKLFSTRRVGCLPVVENGELKGIVTTADLLSVLTRLLEARQAGGGASPSS